MHAVDPLIAAAIDHFSFLKKIARMHFYYATILALWLLSVGCNHMLVHILLCALSRNRSCLIENEMVYSSCQQICFIFNQQSCMGRKGHQFVRLKVASMDSYTYSMLCYV